MTEPTSRPHIEPVPAEPHPDANLRVVIFAPPDDPQQLSDLLVERLHLHPTDAHIQARAVPGILPGHFTREQADEIVDGARTLGIAAEVHAEADIPRLDDGCAETVHHARCTEAGLEIVDLRNQAERTIGWNDLRLLCVGLVPQEASRHYAASEPDRILTSGRRTWVSSMDVPGHSAPEAWLIGGPAGDAYHIDHARMNYEALGDRKTSSAARNFRLFVEDVVAKARGVYLPPSTRAFLHHGLIRHCEFRSSEELQRYTQFHWLLANRVRQSGAPHF